MNSLASRKKLLVAESELNRAQLFHDWQELSGEVTALSVRASSLGFLASTAVSLVSGIGSLWNKSAARTAEKASWLQTILNGAQLARALWSEFHTRKSPDKA
jgi:hypothetical protein